MAPQLIVRYCFLVVVVVVFVVVVAVLCISGFLFSAVLFLFLYF